MSNHHDSSTPRELADWYVDQLVELEPAVATMLGLKPHDDRMPDFSPETRAARAQLGREVLKRLDSLQEAAGPVGAAPADQRCAALLRDRIGVELEAHEAGEDLRVLRNIASPIHSARSLFLLMPQSTPADWAVIARRMAKFPASYSSLQKTLDEGRRRGLTSAPRQVETVIGQLEQWLGGGESWFHEFVRDGPDALRHDLKESADAAATAVARMRTYLRDEYLPVAQGTPDAVGRERYLLSTRRFMGASIDPEEVYAWGWKESH